MATLAERTPRPVPARLTPAARVALAAEILALYARVRWMLHRADLRATLAGLRGLRRPARRQVLGHDPGPRLANAVTRTLPLLPADSRCLMRSLVLTGLLARRGVESTLVIGVSPGERFGAHAWVERGGLALLPSGGDEYGRLVEL